ncbi:MAG: PEGA domain-containing protein [Patescibacteria group bacterium]|jgi:hypothetical protein
MSIGIRRLIFAFFLVFFAIMAPILVLYTAGYRLNISDGILTRTGVLSVETTPKGAAIFLDGEDTGEISTIIFKHLLPGEHLLTISKEGYHAWEDTIEISEGLTTTINHLLLFLENDPTLTFKKQISAIAPHPSGSLVAYTVDSIDLRELWLYDSSNQIQTQLLQTPIATAVDEITIDWSSEGTYLLFSDAKGGIKKIYQSTGEEISLPTIAQEADFLSWHPSDDRILTVVHGEAVTQIDLTNGREALVSEADSSLTLLDASILSFVDNGTYVELRQLIGAQQNLIALLPRSAYDVALRDGQYLVLTNASHGFLLLDLTADQPILLESRGTLFDWLDSESALLWSDGYEINLYTPTSHETTFILRQSETITNIVWHPSGDAILFSTAHALRAIDRYLLGTERQMTTLLEGANLERVWMEKHGKYFYFLGTNQDETGLFELPLR